MTTETKTTPSMPLILFAVADAVARGGLPEPKGLEVEAGGFGLELHFDNQADARRWATLFGIDHTDALDWHAQPYDKESGQYTLVNAYGRWHDAPARIHVLEPIAAATPATEADVQAKEWDRESLKGIYGDLVEAWDDGRIRSTAVNLDAAALAARYPTGVPSQETVEQEMRWTAARARSATTVLLGWVRQQRAELASSDTKK